MEGDIILVKPAWIGKDALLEVTSVGARDCIYLDIGDGIHYTLSQCVPRKRTDDTCIGSMDVFFTYIYKIESHTTDSMKYVPPFAAVVHSSYSSYMVMFSWGILSLDGWTVL